MGSSPLAAPHPIRSVRLLLLRVDDDAPSADLLVHTVVVDDGLDTAGFGPDLDTERIRIIVTRPDLELVRAFTVDRAFALELGEVASGNDEPVIVRRMEVQITGMELELRAPCRDRSTLLALGYETKRCLPEANGSSR